MCERECLYCMCMYICVKVIYYVLVVARPTEKEVDRERRRERKGERGKLRQNGAGGARKVVHFTSYIFIFTNPNAA